MTGQKVQIKCGKEECGHVYDEGFIEKSGSRLSMGVSGIITGMFRIHKVSTGHSTIISSHPDIVEVKVSAGDSVRVGLVDNT